MERVITDKAGRNLTLRKMDALEMLRLFKALGPELSLNWSYVGMAKAAAAVTMIDDVPVPLPVNEANIEAIIQRLGDGGIKAVTEALRPPPLEEVVASAGN